MSVVLAACSTSACPHYQGKITELARAQVGTLRLKLLKIGAVVVCNIRRIRLFLSSAYPWQALFAQVAARLSSA